jgi:hypothetical protein
MNKILTFRYKNIWDRPWRTNRHTKNDATKRSLLQLRTPMEMMLLRERKKQFFMGRSHFLTRRRNDGSWL